ncbi:MAG: hypothetical protein GX951_04970 [Mollicutes bacterium]|nr:hypothetical protein [Mollicutes bacterium]
MEKTESLKDEHIKKEESQSLDYVYCSKPYINLRNHTSFHSAKNGGWKEARKIVHNLFVPVETSLLLT